MKSKLSFFVLFLLLIAGTKSYAAMTLADLLTQLSPSSNAPAILAKVDQFSPQTKTIPFPANDPSLQSLSGDYYLSEKNLNFLQTYKATMAKLPAALHQENSWLDQFRDTVASPNQYFSTPLGKFVKLASCRPHMCGTNLSLLYDPASKNIWGILHITQGKAYLLGSPSDDQLALLLISVKDNLTDYEF